MSNKGDQCASYKRNSQVCKSGFVQKRLCRGSYDCGSCGKVSEK